MLDQVLQRCPEDAHAKEAEGKAAEGIDPAKHRGSNPAFPKTEGGGDADTPENGPDEKADKEEYELHAAYP